MSGDGWGAWSWSWLIFSKEHNWSAVAWAGTWAGGAGVKRLNSLGEGRRAGADLQVDPRLHTDQTCSWCLRVLHNSWRGHLLVLSIALWAALRASLLTSKGFLLTSCSRPQIGQVRFGFLVVFYHYFVVRTIYVAWKLKYFSCDHMLSKGVAPQCNALHKLLHSLPIVTSTSCSVPEKHPAGLKYICQDQRRSTISTAGAGIRKCNGEFGLQSLTWQLPCCRSLAPGNWWQLMATLGWQQWVNSWWRGSGAGAGMWQWHRSGRGCTIGECRAVDITESRYP